MVNVPTPNPMMIAYHKRSDHGRDGAELDSFTCNCRQLFIDYTLLIAAVTVEELCLNIDEYSKAFAGQLNEESDDWDLGYVQGVLDTRDMLVQLVRDLTT